MASKNWWKGALAAAALAGCESEEPAPPDLTERIDEAQLLGSVAAKGSISHVLAHARVLTAAGVEGALVANATAGATADAMTKQYEARKTSCPGLILTHNPGSDTLKLAFPTAGCQLAGVQVSGIVTITVKVEASGALAQFVLQAVKVDARQIDGTITETSADGKAFQTDIPKLVVDKTTFTFQGTFTRDGDGTGTTLQGGGTAQLSGEAAASTFTIQGLHHKFEGCYGDAGQLTWTVESEFIAPAVKKGKTTATVTTLKFDADTPRDGSVDATVQVGASKASAKKEVILPKYGTCPDGTAP